MKPLRALWTVEAGFIEGEPQDEFYREYKYFQEDEPGDPERIRFYQVCGSALGYACALPAYSPQRVRWVKVNFQWFD